MKMDNQAAIKQMQSEKSTTTIKHVDTRFKYICHYDHAKVAQPSFVESEKIIAEFLYRRYGSSSFALCSGKNMQVKGEKEG